LPWKREDRDLSGLGTEIGSPTTHRRSLAGGRIAVADA
jgi:hypothetical protein